MKSTQIKVGLAVAVVLLVTGYFAWTSFRPSQPSPGSPTLVTSVDRGMSEEQRTMFTDRIAEFETTVSQNEAGGTRDIGVILSLGNLYYQIGDLETAAKWYRNILATNPQDAPALENLAQTQLEMEDWAGAEASLRAAANVSAYEPTYLKLADVIEQHFPERTGDVQTVLETGIANLGQTSGLLSRLARWYEAQGMLDEAISHYQVAHQIDPDDQAIEDELDRLKAARAEAAREGLESAN